MTDLSVLQVSVLGAPEFTRDGSPITGFASTKVQALLCYLALTARPHSRDTLVGLLWSDMPDFDAKTNLRQALANLRRLVGDYLLIERDTVAFNSASPHWIDAEEFERLAKSQWLMANTNQREQAVRDLQLAISYFRGDLLEGFYVRDAPEFEEWIVTQRERFRQQALQLFHTLVAHHLANHEYARGIDCAIRLLALDSWREEAHRQLMMLYARNGQRGAALSQYDACRRILAEKIGAEPAAETVELFERIRATDTTRPHLPPQSTPFIGREAETAEIDALLMKPECRLITLVGQGGIGKTRLAIDAAPKQAGAFLNGIYFVPLATIASPDLIFSTIADTLKIPLSGKAKPQTQVIEYLRDKELLLVLDNFEQLVDGANLLADILGAAHDVKMIVTSRERLNLQAEWIVPVDGLPVPEESQQKTADKLADDSQLAIRHSPFASVRLFLQSAGRVHPRLAPNDDEMASIVRICQLVHGVPLGIELAAAWVASQSCREIALEIEQNLGFLATTQSDVPKRQRSLRAAFEHSWNLLTEEEQRVLRALSVFRGGFLLDAATAILDLPKRTETGSIANRKSKIQNSLTALINKSLLRREANERYDMHEMVRQFAEEKLELAAEKAATQHKHALCFLALAEKAEPMLTSPEQAVWLEQFEQEHNNFRAALLWAQTNAEHRIGLVMVNTLAKFWVKRGYLTEGRAWTEGLLRLAEATSDEELMPIRADVLNGLGMMEKNQGDYVQSALHHQASLEIARQLGDPRKIAYALNHLGQIAERQSELEKAAKLYEESLTLKRELGDKRGTAISLSNLGIIVQQQGDYDKAVTLLQSGLALAREVGDFYTIALPLSNLGVVARCQGDYARAALFYAEALGIMRQLGDRSAVTLLLNNLGEIACLQGKYQESAVLLKESLDLAQELGDKMMIATSMRQLAQVIKEQGEFSQAAKMYATSLNLRKGLDRKTDIADSLEAFADLACAQLRCERAARLLGAAEGIREKIRAPMYPAELAIYERLCDKVRNTLGQAPFASVWAKGRAMTLEQAVAFALED